MRELINRLLLIEATMLDPTQIKKRFHLFKAHIENGRPFYTSDGTPVVLKTSEAERFQNMYDQDMFQGSIKAEDEDGKLWPLSSFLKTRDFGGQAIPPGQGGGDTDVGKETAAVKPTQIGITDKDYTGATLAEAIINNEVLASTSYGRAVIDMAQSIISGDPAIIPKEFLKQEAIKKAIVDYAGEYLGVLALVYGRSDFPKKKDFLGWLGGNLQDLTLRFPSISNLAIADSFATIINTETDHQINISSKGTGGGAAPSVSGLVVPDHIRSKKNYKTAIDFIELCQNKNLPKPATVSQVFLAMNLLQERVPDSIPAEFSGYAPWERRIVDQVNDSIRYGTPMPEYEPLWAGVRFSNKASDGGKLTYMVKQAVLNAVNGGALPEFEAAVLEILDYNFIQQYTTVVGKSGHLQFHTQWPAKLDGTISLETKSGSTDPTKGSFSFKLKPKGANTQDEGPESVSDTTSEPAAEPKPEPVDIRPRGAISKEPEISIGRERR